MKKFFELPGITDLPDTIGNYMWDWYLLVGLYLLIDTALVCIGSMRNAPVVSNSIISSSSCVVIGVIVYLVSDHYTASDLTSSLVCCFILALCFPPWLTFMVDFCSVIDPVIDISASGLLSTPSTMVVALSDRRALLF